MWAEKFPAAQEAVSVQTATNCCVTAAWILLFWQKAVFWSPVIRSGTNFANKCRRIPVMGSDWLYALLMWAIYFEGGTSHLILGLKYIGFSILQWCKALLYDTWSDSKVRELIAVKVLHTSLLNTTMIAFKVLPFGSYAPMPAPSPPFKIILELVLWNGLQSGRCTNPDVINVIKMPSFQYFLYLREQKKVTGG